MVNARQREVAHLKKGAWQLAIGYLFYGNRKQGLLGNLGV
jgi:hypothetical protein